MSARSLWGRWVFANGLAELIGLTSTLFMAAGAFSTDAALPLGIFIALGVAGLGAVVEGVAVGGAQWWVLRRVVVALPLRDWVLATALGAFVAWSLGMLPSTIMSAAAAATTTASQPAFDPPLWMQMLLAAGMGIVLGPFLGVPQWLVLRKHLDRAGWWVLANVTAWAVGMPMVFLGTSLIQAGDPTWRIGAFVALGCLLAGLAVGAVHGLWLVWLVRRAGLLGDTVR